MSLPSINPAVRPYQLLVFDWDGTVMDSSGNIVECMRRSLLATDLEPPAAAEMRALIGLGLDEILGQLCPRAPREVQQRAVERYRQLWIAEYRDASVPFPGARRVVTDLRDEGYLLAVATGKGRPGLERDLASLDLIDCFLATRTSHDAPSKPNPHMLLELMDELGTQPAETLMIGDTTFDLEMAHHAGVASVALATGAHSRDRLAGWNPLACLAEIAEFPDWLRSRDGTQVP